MIKTLKKTVYRTKRRIYVLRHSNIKDWLSILFQSHYKILLKTLILQYDGNDEYQKEIDFLKEAKKVVTFPYKKIKALKNGISGYDANKNLPYVIHKNRRLYFANTWSEERALKEYKVFIEVENILGGDFSEKSPHQYQSDSFCVKSTDILLDVGCAEALFSLDVIDKVRKVFLFELNPIWFEPLKATFEKEITSGKLVLVGKNVGGKDTETSVRLSSILEKEEYESLFIKMDIEGSEPDVVKSCKELMQMDKDIRFSCCTYHKQDDANELKSIFESKGYRTEFSDGYVLFLRDKHLRYPYFRKGIIRASKFNPSK